MSGVSNSAIGVVGAAVPGQAAPIAGSDGTNLRLISTDTSGKVYTIQGPVAALGAGWLMANDATGNSIHTAAWTSATTDNTALTFTDGQRYPAVTLHINTTTTITGGVLLFEYSTDAGTNWIACQGLQVGTTTIATSYTCAANDNKAFQFYLAASSHFRIRLHPQITGSGTVNLDIQGQGIPAAPFVTVQGAVAVSGTVTANQGGAPWSVSQSGTWNIATVTAVTAITNSLPAGSNVIGHVITDTGSTTAVTGTVTVSGTVAATQSGNWTSRIVGNAGGIMDFVGQNATAPANSLLVAGEFNTTPTTITNGNASPLQLDNAGNLLVNVKAGASNTQYANGSAQASPTGTVFLGWDATSVHAVRTDSSGNLFAALKDGVGTSITSNSTGVSTTAGIDINVRSILNTAPTTAGKLDVKGADGDVFVRQATGSNLHTVVDSGTVTLSTLSNSTTGSAPAAATVGVASASAVSSNASRKGLVLTNTSANTISLGFGANAAVLNSGITLVPYSVFVMDAFTFTTAAVNAIASAASSNLAVQEMT